MKFRAARLIKPIDWFHQIDLQNLSNQIPGFWSQAAPLCSSAFYCGPKPGSSSQ